MKEKQFACVILGAAIFACFFGIMKMQTILQNARKEAESAKTDAESVSRERVVAVSAFSTLEKQSRGELAYYEIWKPHFEGFQDGTDVNTRFNDHISNKVEPIEQESTPVGFKDEYGVIAKIQRIDLVFVDDYEKLFTWLGVIENQIPTCRVMSCVVRKAAGDQEHIRMELSIDVPLIEQKIEEIAKAS